MRLRSFPVYALIFVTLTASVAPAWADDCACDNSPQTWQPQPAKAAIMFVATHPDDEALSFRGAIALYNTVRGMPTVGINTSNPGVSAYDLQRRDELRAAYWTYGMRNEPLFGGFPDDCFGSCPSCTIASWGWDNLVGYLTEQIRRYKPEVIVTHDYLGGRDHHSNHIVTERATQAAFLAANDPGQFPEQLSNGLELWQPKKLYINSDLPNSWVHDWYTEYPQLGNRTPQCVADGGLLCHVSQGLPMRPEEGHLFSLLETTVGPDVIGGDFFENIAPLITEASADVTSGPSGLTVHFTGSAISYGPNAPTYEWTLGDGNSVSDPNATHTYNLPNGTYWAYLTVADGILRAVSDPIPIMIGQPPELSNVMPTDGALFHAGDVINLSVDAIDPDGALDPNAYEWDVTIIRDGRRDPAFGPFTGPTASFTIPASGVDFGGDVSYRIELRVTDADGLFAKSVAYIYPEQVDLTFDSDPSGLGLVVDGKSQPTPFVVQTAVGTELEVRAPRGCQLIRDLDFLDWSDGGSRIHTVVAPAADDAYTASYAVSGPCLIDFNDETVGGDPKDWYDTQAAPSAPNGDDSMCLLPEDLFKVADFSGDPALSTSSPLTNIHSHYDGPAAHEMSNYEVTGRMYVTSTIAGIGVTFLSDYPNTDSYYVLRRGNFLGGTFRIYSHGTSITGGNDNSGVFGSSNVWWRFRIQAEDTGSRTEIRANVWQDGSSEPSAWQIECYDDSPTRLTKGTIGVWAMMTGTKYWDDLGVTSLTLPTCVGDLSGDNNVNIADLGILLGNFGCSGGGCAGDVDGDGDTDITDLGFMLSNFGLVCP